METAVSDPQEDKSQIYGEYNMGSQKVTVCKDCPDRHMGCHAECEQYKYQKAKWEAERKHINEQKQREYDYIGRTRDTQDRFKKRKHRR